MREQIPTTARSLLLFRRTDSSTTATPGSDSTTKVDGKGRPTPTRKEAQAAARARATSAMDKKGAKKVLRERRTMTNAQMRAGMKSGDERFLPARDKGPVKRFIRDWIDARLSVAEFLLPLLVIIMVLQYSGPSMRVLAGNVMAATVLLTAVDTIWLVFKLKRALRAKFPDDELRGTTSYSVLRVMQVRFMRMPKPKVKLGGKPR
jgi:hypothetical protein